MKMVCRQLCDTRQRVSDGFRYFMGKSEANPLLCQSRFGMRHTVIKIGPVPAALAGEYFLVPRRNSHAGSGLAAINFASASVLGAIACHNSTVPQIPKGIVRQ
jgi:hypothetical protein